jgi:hypothetical protein
MAAVACRFYTNRRNKDGNTVAETMEHMGNDMLQAAHDNTYITVE